MLGRSGDVVVIVSCTSTALVVVTKSLTSVGVVIT